MRKPELADTDIVRGNIYFVSIGIASSPASTIEDVKEQILQLADTNKIRVPRVDVSKEDGGTTARVWIWRDISMDKPDIIRVVREHNRDGGYGYMASDKATKLVIKSELEKAVAKVPRLKKSVEIRSLLQVIDTDKARVHFSDNEPYPEYYGRKKRFKRTLKVKPFSVAWYMQDMAYGGPEEGGWWYDVGVPDIPYGIPQYHAYPRFFRSKEKAYKYRNMLVDKYVDKVNEGRREISSVLSEGRWAPILSTGKPTPYPDRTPHYC